MSENHNPTNFEIAQKYLALFPKSNVDRFTISCPDCGVGRNSKCDTCGLVECEVTSL